MAVSNYSTDPDLNTSISGINIAEGCAPSGINNAIRQMMADIKTDSDALDGKIDDHVGDIKADTVLAAQSAGDVSGGSLGTVDLNEVLSAYETVRAEVTSLDAAVAATISPGVVVAFAANSEPEGYLLCNGATVSRTTYAALFAAIGTTYGSGNGSTTFNIPNLIDRFIQGSGTAGTVKAAGLPQVQMTNETEITLQGGTVKSAKTSLLEATGSKCGSSFNTGACVHTGAVGMDVSNHSYSTAPSALIAQNAIYGASDTVQPPAVTMRYYIKY